MIKRSLCMGFALIPCLALAQDDEITLSHIKYCYNLWGSAVICAEKSAWVTKNDYIDLRQVCNDLVKRKYGTIPQEIYQMGRQAAYDGASETGMGEGFDFDTKCSLVKSQVVNLLKRSGLK